MICKVRAVFLLWIIACVLSGCASGVPHTIVGDYHQRGVRLIVLAPVDNRTNDKQAAQLLRENILEKLYAKGYPRIPLDMIDEKLASDCGWNPEINNACDLSPEIIGKLLNVDAVMYCSLLEWKTSFISIYAPTTVSVSLRLRDAKTGTELWSSQYRVVDRHYDFTRKRLELKACQSYEPAIRKIIDETLSSLPDGPDCVENPPPEKRFWELW
ncbi:MAG TPA: DUF799 family lipoprotein [Syntrophales bacterium]|nr:DUF799 family lipoprotein [Syntrophales bacterium]HPQ45041.1 DUF799 family lipoprotein [Syntrophales bacterium]